MWRITGFGTPSAENYFGDGVCRSLQHSYATLLSERGDWRLFHGRILIIRVENKSLKFYIKDKLYF